MYVQITVDYVMAAAAALPLLPPQSNLSMFQEKLCVFHKTFSNSFCSSFTTQADVTERSVMFFARIKGRAENNLRELASRTPSLNLFVARPGIIDSDVHHPSSDPPSPIEIAIEVLKTFCANIRKGVYYSC